MQNSNDWLIDEMKDILRKIAYPKKGTDEEAIDINDAAKMIQDKFTLEDLIN